MGNDRKVKKYYFSKFEEYSRLEAILNEEKLLLKYMIKKSILSIVSKAYLLEFDPEKLEAIDYYCPLNL